MPNRGELAGPITHADRSAEMVDATWAVVRFCAIGTVLALYFAVYAQPLERLPMLIAQLNFG